MEGVIEQLWTVVMGECWAWQVVDFFVGWRRESDASAYLKRRDTVSTDLIPQG